MSVRRYQHPSAGPPDDNALPDHLRSFSVDAWTDLPEEPPAEWLATRECNRGTHRPSWSEHRAMAAALAHQRAVVAWRREHGIARPRRQVVDR